MRRRCRGLLVPPLISAHVLIETLNSGTSLLPFKNTEVERKEPQGGIISQTEITGGWNGPGWVIFHLPAWLVSRIRDLKWNYPVVTEQRNKVGAQVPEETAHTVPPKDAEETITYFSITLIPCGRVHVLAGKMDELCLTVGKKKLLVLHWSWRWEVWISWNYLWVLIKATHYSMEVKFCTFTYSLPIKYKHKQSRNCAKLQLWLGLKYSEITWVKNKTKQKP